MFKLPQNKKGSLGKSGEKAAETFLKAKGYKIIDTNFTNPKGRRLGEIDIIAKDREEFVFIEVKTRILSDYQTEVNPEENINLQKLHKLQKIAVYYIQSKKLWDFSYRFDGISVVYDKKLQTYRIRHLKSIFL